MVFIAAFILGMTFASAGLVAKHINSGWGMQIANRRAHEYVSWLGALSNLILPICAVVVAVMLRGIGGGVMAALGLVVGALVLGMLKLPYPFKLLLAVFVLPVAALFFLFSIIYI